MRTKAAKAANIARDDGVRAMFAAVWNSVETLVHEIAKFGAVGLIALVVDIGLFNVLSIGFDIGPLTSKTISVAAATTVAYFGNRYWTFRHRGRANMGREYALFFVLNGVGMLIALTCLAFSHYVLQLQSALADNISANVIGLGLGTLFRFWSYRKWVFPEVSGDGAASELAERDAVTPI